MFPSTCWLRPLLCLGVAIFLVAPARADSLDFALSTKNKAILRYLQNKNVETVGVLKFQASVGSEKPRLDVGPINSVMAERLETVLILGTDPAHPLNIIRDASSHAAAQKGNLDYRDATGRKELLDLSYPLVFGEKSVKPDLFLTGLVHLDLKALKTKVTLLAFDNKSKALEDTGIRFEVPLDRSTLADAGRGFVLTREQLMDKRGAFDEHFGDELAANQVQNNPVTVLKSPNKLVAMKILIEGKGEMEMVDDESHPGAGYFRTPRKFELGDKVRIQLTNLTDRVLAVVVKVNGMNTLYEQKLDAINCSKWVLDAKQTLTIKGFYLSDDGKNLAPFKVIPEEEFVAKGLADSSMGTISMHVFVKGDEKAKEAKVVARAVVRGYPLRKWEEEKTKLASMKDVKAFFQPLYKVFGRNILFRDDQLVEGAKLVTENFWDPQEAQVLFLRYHR